jgi:hypothetical protein
MRVKADPMAGPVKIGSVPQAHSADDPGQLAAPLVLLSCTLPSLTPNPRAWHTGESLEGARKAVGSSRDGQGAQGVAGNRCCQAIHTRVRDLDLLPFLIETLHSISSVPLYTRNSSCAQSCNALLHSKYLSSFALDAPCPRLPSSVRWHGWSKVDKGLH